MKRIVIAAAAVFVLMIGAIAFLISDKRSVPKYVPGTPAKAVPYPFSGFDSSADVPFPDGTFWIYSADTNNAHHTIYRYNLNQRKILGQLFHSSMPFLQSGDGARVLLAGPPTGAPDGLQRALVRMDKIFRTRFSSKTRMTDNFWILDTRNNSARKVIPGSFGTWRASPDCRYGFSASVKLESIYDLESEAVNRVNVSGMPVGWWDNQDILIDDFGNFRLFNIGTGNTRTIFADTLMTQNSKTNLPRVMRPLVNWNGHEYDFYFNYVSRISVDSGEVNSVLFKIDRTGPALKLLYPHFKFERDGVLDAAGTHYLFSGESAPGSGGDGSVYLRDLATEKTTMLVPPDKRGEYASPRFFGDEVIYIRNRVVRRIKLDGTGDEAVLVTPGL